MPIFSDAYNVYDGTATLVAGAVTVANTSITANAVIECGVLTPAGTQGGAPFVKAKTAATSFQLSTGGASDTSVVWYRIRQY